MNQARNPLMKAFNLVILPAGLLLVASLFAGIYYDARHGAAHYHGEAVTALPAHR